ncbi:family 16 glycosylhydrolase [Patescibacteria group bacterium]|uniref:Putative glycoside hydrolase n=1 Tax=viral metagenome TaxID=1070528 RepID=A0A6M3X598_9ZZZZ|nr:family 16 glycosylhydrolase [Patescibacteria group bacterium]
MSCYNLKFKLSGKKALSYKPEDSLKNKYPKLKLLTLDTFGMIETNWRYNFAYGDSHLPYRHRDDNIIARDYGAEFMLKTVGDVQTAGIIISKFTIKNGLIQVRAMFPCTAANQLDAIWTMGVNGMPENDVAEWTGDYVTVNRHWGYDYRAGLKKQMSHIKREAEWFKPYREFYIYGLELTPYETIFSINGVTTLRTEPTNNDQYIILNSGIQDSRTHVNGVGMIADWIRVYIPELE